MSTPLIQDKLLIQEIDRIFELDYSSKNDNAKSKERENYEELDPRIEAEEDLRSEILKKRRSQTA